MTITVYPVDAVSNAPAYSGRMQRQVESVFLPLADPARPFGARSGVRAGTPASTASISGTTWTCGAHAGVLDVEASASAGAYKYAVSTPETGTITAADASNARVDRVFVQLSDPAEGDGSSVPKAEVLYLAGTPAGSPVPPTLPARTSPLFKINVPKVGGGNPTVTWEAPSIGGGLIIPSSVVGGTVGPSGAVTYSAVTSVLLNGVFTPLFDNYLIVINNTAKSLSTNVAFQLAAAGTFDGTVAHYSGVRGYDHGTSRTVESNPAIAAIEVEAGQQARADIKVDVFSPALPVATQLDARATAPSYRTDVAGLNSQATAWDGFRLSPNPNGTITGTVRVYGYNN